MISKDIVLNLINEKIEETGQKFFLVDLKISSNNKITIELDHEDKSVSIDDCILFSRQVEHNLDREKEDFELEVSSAGLSNPFKVKQQYQKNIGRSVKVLTKNGKSIEGELLKVDEEKIFLKYEKTEKVEGKKKKIKKIIEEEIFFDKINQTKLVITFK